MLVYQGGLNIEYVLDRMQWYEVKPMLDNIYLKDKQQAELLRLNSYVTAQVNSTKRMKPTDIIKFSWEHEAKKVFNRTEMADLKARAEQFKQLL